MQHLSSSPPQEQENSGSLQPPGSSHEDFSVISSPGSSNYLSEGTEWPDSFLYQSASIATNISPISGDYKCTNEGLLSSSHYALATAYDKLKRKFAESEKQNEVLRKQMKPTIEKPMATSISSASSLNPNSSDEINRAWEAYREKCRECEQMRDQLKNTQHKLQSSESTTRLQTLNDEVHREKARYNDLQQELNSCRGSMEHIGQKEMLAREALLKEKEYQTNLLAATEKKHLQMQAEIDDLKAQLQAEEEQRNCIMRTHKEEINRQQEIFTASQTQHTALIRGLEERNILLQENVSKSRQQMEEMSMKTNDYYSSGSTSSGFVSEGEIVDILAEVKSLTTELEHLRDVSRKQKRLLTALVATPQVENILKQLNIGNNPTQDPTNEQPASMETSISSNGSSKSSVDQYYTPPLSFITPNGQKTEQPISDPPPVIKTTDQFIRDLHKGNKSPFSQQKSKAHFTYQPPIVGVSRIIHDSSGSASRSSHDMLELNNVPDTFHNHAERATLNIHHEDVAVNDDLQLTSINSNDGNDSSMLTLQPAKFDADVCISSDEDNAPKPPSHIPSTSRRSNPARSDHRTIPPVPAKPAITPQNKPIAQPTADVTALNQFCPVCNYKFMPGANERAMGRHINSHFSDDEDGDFLQIP